MEKIILTTPEELRVIIEEVIHKRVQPPSPKVEVITDNLSLDEAINYLKSEGLPTSKAKIYRLTSTNQLPYSKYGNKLIFSRKELLEWAKSQVVHVSDTSESMDALLKSVKDKNKRRG